MQRLNSGSRGIVLALLFALVLQFAACGGVGGSQIDRAAKASATVAQYTGQAITIVGDLFKAGAISLETKDKLADLLIKFSKGGKEFNDLVISVNNQVKGGAVPINSWAQITAQFNQLISVFMQIVDAIPQAAGLANSKAFKTITAAVLVISQILMQSAGVPRQTQLTARNAFNELNRRIARSGISLVGIEI